MTKNREDRIRKNTDLHMAMEVKNVLGNFSAEPADRPESMGYFNDFVKKFYQDGMEISTALPVIGTMCVMVPDELIHAAGATPLRLCCGASACDQAGAEFMPAKSCPLVRSTMGFLYANRHILSQKIKAIVIPTTCDQKRKSAEQLRFMGYQVIQLEMPPSVNSEHGRRYWHESVKCLALSLEKLTGVRITRDALRNAINKVGAASGVFRELHDMRKHQPSVINGSDVLLVNNVYFLDRIESWTEAVRILNTELHERLSRTLTSGGRRMRPRILLTGSPPVFPNFKVPLLVEQSGAVIAADEVCSSTRMLYDTVVYDEENLYDMIPAVADRYLKSCTCPCLASNDNRIRKILELVREAGIDGVLYQSFSGCMPYEMEQKAVADVLGTVGVPMLYVETDYSPEDLGQLSTRVEAFVESIKSRKRKAEFNG